MYSKILASLCDDDNDKDEEEQTNYINVFESEYPE